MNIVNQERFFWSVVMPAAREAARVMQHPMDHIDVARLFDQQPPQTAKKGNGGKGKKGC